VTKVRESVTINTLSTGALWAVPQSSRCRPTCISTWSSRWQVRVQIQVLTLQVQVRVQVL